MFMKHNTSGPVIMQISAYVTPKNSVERKNVQALRTVYTKCLSCVERNI